MMKGKKRFKTPNCRAVCLLAKAFGMSAANPGERTRLACWFWRLTNAGVFSFAPTNWRKNSSFFEMSALKILRKEGANQINNRQ
jgi:hypothetical protein